MNPLHCARTSSAGIGPALAHYHRALPSVAERTFASFAVHKRDDGLFSQALDSELRVLTDAERFDAKTMVLIENVTHHIDEEEQEWFPKVREALSRKQLQEIGARMLELKESAPRHPSQPSAMKKTIDAVVS